MFLRLCRGVFWALMLAGINAAFAGVIFIAVLYEKLPSLDNIIDYAPRLPMRIYSAEGDLIGEFGEERRTVTQYRDFPDLLVNALLATEDTRFFDHFGVDFYGLARAALGYTAGRREGASTITMQVARNFYLQRTRTILRKIVEVMVALKIEQQFSKREILQLYMNQIYLGHGSYGFAAAAREYYGKKMDELTVAEAAVLAGLPKSPSGVNPRSHPVRAKERQRHVLNRMFAVGLIGEESYSELSSAPLPPLAKTVRRLYDKADYAAEEVRKIIFAHYGDTAYEIGLNIYTTIQSRLQKLAQDNLRRGLLAHELRQPYPGPEKYIDTRAIKTHAGYVAALRDTPIIGGLQPAIVISAAAGKVVVVAKDGEKYEITGKSLHYLQHHLLGGETPSMRAGAVVRLAGDGEEMRIVATPGAQAALVILSSDDGAILALVGGFDFAQNNFNNAFQARRQPGSALKPFFYSAALEKGVMPTTLLPDTPIFLTAKETGSEASWQPKNYDGKMAGEITMRRALTKSKNLATVHLMKYIGVAYGRDYLLRFGFSPKDNPAYLSLALGASAATPLEIARGYATFSNGGYLVNPYLITRIEDYDGNTIVRELDFEARSVVIDQRNAFIMTSLLQSVIREGTGVSANSLNRQDIGGKTGTTNDTRDAWFAGFGGNFTAVSWVGYPDFRSLGDKETGSRAALPIWRDFMAAALANRPQVEYAQPSGVIAIDVGRESGKILSSGASENLRREYFYSENLPVFIEAEDDSSNEVEGLF